MACGAQANLGKARRRAALAGVVVAVAVVHVRLLDGVAPDAPVRPSSASAHATLEVRTIAAELAPRIELAIEAAPVEHVPQLGPQRKVERPFAAVPPARATVAPLPPLPADIDHAAEPATLPAHADAPAIPAYRTAVAPSTQLRYRVERGDRIGSAELSWQVSDDAYEARLEIVYEGVQRLALRRVSRVSQGRIDGAGVAPQRHTERRPRSGMQAVNFERDVGEISFSGPSWRLPLATGAQDGLSWMLQLAAIAQAEPERARAGGEIVLTVVGLRGEAQPWRFRFEALESMRLATEPPALAKWVREPDEPYGARIEVWLDPARHHLPVRLRSGLAGANGTFDMVLDE